MIATNLILWPFEKRYVKQPEPVLCNAFIFLRGVTIEGYWKAKKKKKKV